MRSQNNDLRIGEVLLDPIERFQTIGVGQLQIEQDKRRRFRLQCAQSKARRRCRLRLIPMTGQERFQRHQNRALIIDDEDAPRFGIRSHSCSMIPLRDFRWNKGA